MPDKKELNEEDIKNVSGGWMEDTDDPEKEQIVSIPVDGNCSEGNIILGSNARPNH